MHNTALILIEACGLKEIGGWRRIFPTVLKRHVVPASAGAMVFAVCADGTVPSVERLIWVPVRVPFLTFAAVIASFFTFVVVTAFIRASAQGDE